MLGAQWIRVWGYRGRCPVLEAPFHWPTFECKNSEHHSCTEHHSCSEDGQVQCNIWSWQQYQVSNDGVSHNTLQQRWEHSLIRWRMKLFSHIKLRKCKCSVGLGRHFYVSIKIPVREHVQFWAQNGVRSFAAWSCLTFIPRNEVPHPWKVVTWI